MILILLPCYPPIFGENGFEEFLNGTIFHVHLKLLPLFFDLFQSGFLTQSRQAAKRLMLFFATLRLCVKLREFRKVTIWII